MRRTLLTKIGLYSLLILGVSCRDEIGEQKKMEKTPPSIQVIPTEINMSSGFKHTLVLNENGELSGWGYNEYGELNNKQKGVLSFNKIDQSMWKSVSAGYNFSVGVKKDGTLWATGYNTAGQLGTGNIEDQDVFVQIGKDNDWVKVSAGYRHTLAMKKDGTIWAWGLNLSNQLGDGSDVPSNVPKKIGDSNDWKDISTGHNQCFAIKKDGSLWAWGYNYYGQLGLGHKNNISVPTKVDNSKWKVVVTGISLAGGIKEDGSLWMWGRNYQGQLGTGTGNFKEGNDSSIPVKVDSDIPWKKLSIGNRHVLALKSDNTLWSWGGNMRGELGTEDKTGYSVYRNKPAKVNEDKDWKDISAGEFFSVAQKENRSYWGWGINRENQLSTTITEIEIIKPTLLKN